MKNTHSITIGYVLWIFGFMGAHRFYFGKQITGTLWFLTFGMFGVGWIIDLFLIPGMDRDAEIKYTDGKLDYTVAWLLLGFLGFLGIHRFYMGKWATGLVYLLTGGLFTVGWLYDLWNLNGMYATFGVTTEVVFTAIVDVINARKAGQKPDWGLKGFSYIWMLPIYGSIAFLAPLVFPHFQDWNILLRLFVYGWIILGVEYVTGWILKLWLGRCPWHYESRWAIQNVIRLDYLPLWMGFACIIEWLYYL